LFLHPEPHLYVGDVAFLGEIEPIRFIQLWTDEKVQVVNLIILAYQRGCKVQGHAKREKKNEHKSLALKTRLLRVKEESPRTSETKLCVGIDVIKHQTEKVGRHNVHLIQDQQAPFTTCQPLHRFPGFECSLSRKRHHTVGRNHNARI
jgi:hypothetical protein